jgi:hypothetical protein
MKPYNFIETNLLPDIQVELFNLINNSVNVDTIEGWYFLDKKTLKDTPSVLQFCRDLKLIIQDFSIIVLKNDLPKHVDALPQVAKINIPIANTQGWTNVWYSITDEQLAECPSIEAFGDVHEDVSKLNMPVLDTIVNLDKIIVFNSRIPHSVIKINPSKLPRIVTSLTFKKQPLELLQ